MGRKPPKSFAANLGYRREVLDQARKHPSLQPYLIDKCRADVPFWIDTFVCQFNGKDLELPRRAPFVCWDYQEAALEELDYCIRTGRDAVIEKSRDMGATWLCLIKMIHHWLFREWETMLCISRNEKAVEDAKPDSLFWKIDFVLDYLPTWMLQGYEPKKHRRKLYFGHPNGSAIYGEASTGQAGVGGKCSWMFVDEFSQIEEGHEVLHRTSDTTRCRIFNGTHLGLGTAFFELCDPRSVVGAYIRKVLMHWTQHPQKRKGLYRYESETNKLAVLDTGYAFPADYQFVRDGTPTGGPFPGVRSPFYDDQVRRKGNPRAIAMDLDINPSGSVSQVFDPVIIRHLIATFAREPSWWGELEYDRDLGRPLGLTPGKGGKLKLWLVPDAEGHLPLALYIVAADPSQGTGATPSCITILNARTGEKVGEWEDAHTDPTELAAILVSLCWLFKDEGGQGAHLGWEAAGPGLTVGKRVLLLGYRNIHWREAQKLGGKPTDIPGWPSSPANKRLIINEYQRGLRDRKFLNRSTKALEETLAFKYNASGIPEHARESNPKDASGARENHGDHVIADALAWWLARPHWTQRRAKDREPEAAAWCFSVEGRRAMRRRLEEAEGE